MFGAATVLDASLLGDVGPILISYSRALTSDRV